MKIKLIILLSLPLFILSSCSSDDDGITKPDPKSPTYVNDWIYEQMGMYYLWNETLPSNPDKSLSPDKFFDTLLNKSDRFSWIQDNYLDLMSSLSGVSSGDIGFEYVGYLISEGSDLVVGQIAYVKPNTPAQSAGLKRGDLFTKVDGVALTTTNWRALLSGQNSTAQITFVDSEFVNQTNKTIGKISKYAENPVYMDSTYTVSNKKIGYLVYNFFANDNGSGDRQYDLQLNKVFAGFKSKGITDLVLDLRYNSGGSMLSGVILSSLIVPDLSTDKVFSSVQFNSLYQAAYVKKYGAGSLTDKFMDKIEVNKTKQEKLNNPGTIRSLYVLTSNLTASASEMLINGLKPYMNVYLIGTTTVGKNVGSYTIYDQENSSTNKWGMQPIVLKYFNSNGTSDFEKGFTPDEELIDNNVHKFALGDLQEVMLQTAIQKITGVSGVRNTQADAKLLQSQGSSVERKPWSNKGIVDNRVLVPMNNLQE
ncbi:peptidase S41 [Dysgonomonas sp. HDW5B]|uniref:S41 family peptidase n=1 Tax=Dysgonomonas sp. HDW5B TaxID=2714927 RepID=UPI0014083BC4|nr:S41 family peptidase [Dysgonomonas sp. HDW5B]QIK53807.1 peptidase S41 [Dysgonomonas sp. HDW5B]